MSHSFHLVANALAAPDAPYGPVHREVLRRDQFGRASAEIRSWSGYEPTPLHRLTRTSEECGVASVLYKDESGRFGLGSFKALGGAYAVSQALVRQARLASGIVDLTTADLGTPPHRAFVSAQTVTCATDGNHGRSVAWGAHRFGCSSVIFLHEGVSRGRAEAIEAWGGRVERVRGNFDDAVRQSAERAARSGWIAVPDTAPAPDPQIPRDVLQGYTVMVDEVLTEIGPSEYPTHIFVQAGVGGLAAAVCGHIWERSRDRRPTVVVVEPEGAPCVFRAIEAGTPVAVRGALETVMAGLACGEVSSDAWRILRAGADFAMTISDAAALETMRYLARGEGHGAPIVAGESGVAGLAGLLYAARDSATRRRVGLTERSVVLLVGTEGATDADIYARIVTGRSHAIS